MKMTMDVVKETNEAEERHSLLLEGSAAMPVAAFLKQKEHFKRKNVVLILTSSKIDLGTLKEILC